ncbi:uncharacterized protein LOC134286958 [Aedes albopictus]|uniref:Integrase catalytic domain-containing protein n=1 Tax=Aedes albopictus TaxID=7160 RepID=A0ABM1XW27_AEDAL
MAERAIKKKIKKRERMFATLKRHQQFLDSYNHETQCEQVQSRLDKLDGKLAQFEQLQEEIAELDENEQFEEESNKVAERFESQYYAIRGALVMKIAPPVVTPTPLDNSVMRNTATAGFHSGVQISLPDFEGDYRTWLSFKSTYESLIHESMELSDVQKFHYLKSALKGEAAKLIESLTITGGNYVIAWETITKRYSNEYLLKKRHLQALMEYPKIQRETAAAIHGLVDEFEQRLKILKQLGERTDNWGALIVHWMCSKLNDHCLQLWEDHAASLDEPSFTDLMKFLEKRTRVLEAVSSNVMESSKPTQKATTRVSKQMVHAATGNEWERPTSSATCPCCGENHYMARCAEFFKMNLQEKLELVNNKRLCSNCFRAGHWVRECKSTFNCRTCGRKHHSLIHPGFPPGNASNDDKPGGSQTRVTDARGTSTNVVTNGSDAEECDVAQEVLAIRDQNGNKQLARALLDNGSEANIMTERMCQILKLKRRSVNVPVCGVGESETRARHAVSTIISSRVTDFAVEVNFLVLQRVTSDLPAATVSASHWKFPEDIRLADPNFNNSDRIDLLIGAEHFYQFLYEREMKRISLGAGLPILIETVFGWVVTGKYSAASNQPINCCVATSPENLEAALERFWQVENNDDQPLWSKEEQDCETHFLETHSRLEDGRYIVVLPKHINFDRMIGESRSTTLDRFLKLEKRLERNSEMKEQYHAFMQEYLDLGHMRKVDDSQICENTRDSAKRKTFYLPHHAVLKESSTTTKVRVVFDGSARTDSGYSLNDALLKGPIIQDELLTLLLRFRKHHIALVGDVEKMYRQIRLHPDDTSLQRIFWRFSTDHPISEYELLTVTYGLTPSSFLSIRALHQLAADEGAELPAASASLVHDFYVDDYIGGASSLAEAIELRQDLTSLMSKGGFVLRKWCSNHPEVLVDVPPDQLGTNLSITFQLNPGEEIKTLGISWEPSSDKFRFNVDIEDNGAETVWTRRRILSCIAKLFDPLGLISPVVVYAKIIMQQLALLQTSWDDPVPVQLEEKWTDFYKQLNKLGELRINRFAFIPQWVDVQIHCFADASELAYGACLYVRTTDQDGNTNVEMLSSRSRVAPLKRLTLPRLELCAAKEAASLHSKVIKALDLGQIRSTFWSDSTIVLHWLEAPPNTWKTFVANRVSSIQSLSQGHRWQHIAGKENPADLVSRGMTVNDFLQSQIWKNGPPWLRGPEVNWPSEAKETDFSEEELETRKIVSHIVQAPFEPHALFSLRSSLEPLLRIVAFCLRFCRNCRSPKQRNRSTCLTVEEISSAKLGLVKLAQAECFALDIGHLEKHLNVSRKSSLRRLCPFLDKDGIVRVGGRLRHSDQDYGAKHPAILPSAHPFTKLLVSYYHRQTIHGGRQLTLSTMRQEFWPIHGKRVVDGVLRKCFRCFRVNPTPIQQPTGQLPSTRVRPSRPFSITGVDYCGPFYLKPPHRRAAAPKAYIAVFVCFATKAMHQEIVSDLSTAGFLAALRRFVGHHGIPLEIHSDNAKNFAGAKNELIDLYNTLNDKTSKERISNELSLQGISWKFIPPRAPNFGGLWEAAVRSVKTALKKEIGTRQLSHEHFSTLLVQIAAALNSRPLVPLSDDPSDLSALTPSHFLIGAPMNALPERDLLNIPASRLNHHQQQQQMFQHYWERWSKDYLAELQTSSKNHEPIPIRIGSLVVLREDNMPPLYWPLARIVDIHPSTEGVVRVVTVKTTSGVYKRPVCRICPLPSDRETVIEEGSPVII